MVTLVAIRGLLIAVPSLVEEHGLKSRAQWLWRMDLVADYAKAFDCVDHNKLQKILQGW